MTDSERLPTDSSDEAGSNPQFLALGAKVRRFRAARRMSLRQLAEKAQTSAGFLSQIERGMTGVSTSILMRIANALGVGVADLFDDREGPSHRAVRYRQRPALPPNSLYHKTLLSQRPIYDFVVYGGEFEIGGSTGQDPYTHGNSHEMLLVIRGRVRVWLGEESYDLEAGDNIEYTSSTPHKTENIHDGISEVIWIVSPPVADNSRYDMFTVQNRMTNSD